MSKEQSIASSTTKYIQLELHTMSGPSITISSPKQRICCIRKAALKRDAVLELNEQEREKREQSALSLFLEHERKQQLLPLFPSGGGEQQQSCCGAQTRLRKRRRRTPTNKDEQQHDEEGATTEGCSTTATRDELGSSLFLPTLESSYDGEQQHLHRSRPQLKLRLRATTTNHDSCEFFHTTATVIEDDEPSFGLDLSFPKRLALSFESPPPKGRKVLLAPRKASSSGFPFLPCLNQFSSPRSL